MTTKASAEELIPKLLTDRPGCQHQNLPEDHLKDPGCERTLGGKRNAQQLLGRT